jgi:putative cell wall-binding protein
VHRHLRSLVAVLMGLAATSGFIAAGGAARADSTGVVSVISVPGYGGLLTTAASKVYLATGSSSGILVFSSNGTQLPTIADPGNITGLYASPDGARLYVEHSNAEAIEVISTATDAPIQTYDTSTTPLNPLVPWQLAQTGKWLFVLGHPVGGMGSSPYVIDTSQPTPTIRGLSFTGVGGLLMTVAATTLAGGTVGVDMQESGPNPNNAAVVAYTFDGASTLTQVASTGVADLASAAFDTTNAKVFTTDPSAAGLVPVRNFGSLALQSTVTLSPAGTLAAVTADGRIVGGNNVTNTGAPTPITIIDYIWSATGAVLDELAVTYPQQNATELGSLLVVPGSGNIFALSTNNGTNSLIMWDTSAKPYATPNGAAIPSIGTGSGGGTGSGAGSGAGGGGGGGAASTSVVDRISGSDRYATAAAISQAEFPTGGAAAVVLARGDDYPDALVGAPLAAAKNAPLLLTTGPTMPTVTQTELHRVLAPGATVYVLGGTSAVPTSVTAVLGQLGYKVVRYAGADRFATAVAVAGALGNPGTVLLASATNFPDALAAGPAAHLAGGAVLLTDGNAMVSGTASYLGAHPGTVYAIGGPAASADPSATAIVGADRYGTAAGVAARFFTSPTTVGVATGLDYPDALAGGALLAKEGAPLLLASPTALPLATSKYLIVVGASVTGAQLFGGSAVLPDTTATDIAAALS